MLLYKLCKYAKNCIHKCHNKGVTSFFWKYLVFLPPCERENLFVQIWGQNELMELIMPNVKRRSIAMF